jgi:alpha-tubulin suppressor-like RCC1 family protein
MPSLRPSRMLVRSALLVLAALLMVPSLAAAKHQTYLADGFDGLYSVKPAQMTLLGPAQVFVINLKWRSWGGDTARATGLWGRHDCRTGCGAGPLIDRAPVRIVLSHPRVCLANNYLPQNTWYYRDRTMIFTKRVPDGLSRRSTTRFICPPPNPEPGTIHRATPAKVKRLGTTVADVSAGDGHACARTKTAAVWCWGSNEAGELGDGTNKLRLAPVAVPSLQSGVVSISAGADHTCAVTDAGAAKCWGDNSQGQLGDGTQQSRATPVDVAGLGSGVAAISASDFHTCALTTAGGVKCWGYNEEGELGNGTTTPSLVPVDVTGLGSGVTAISTGFLHTCALTQAGDVLCWGFNRERELGDGTTTDRNTPVPVVGLGGGNTAVGGAGCALTSGGGVKCWGDNADGALGDGTREPRSGVVDVRGLASGVTAVTADLGHACAVTAAGAARCWGDGSFGALGNGKFRISTTPVAVRGLTSGVARVDAGNGFSCAVTTAGRALCWGSNESGELGAGINPF